MLSIIVNALFGCTHRRTTFPMTSTRRNIVSQQTTETRPKTYVACLDCGKEMDYDWKQMRIATAASSASPLATPRTVTLNR